MQAAPSQAAPAQNSKKTPGNFANLNEYLRVNAPQEFGQQVAGKIGGEIDEGNRVVDESQNEFKSRVDANTVRDTQGLTDQLSTNPQGIDKDAFAQIRDASYKGPKTLADTQDLSSRVLGAAGTATGKAAASGSESGRFALLDSYFGKPSYSQGQKTLDNLLIQNDPNSQQAFGEMRSRATELADKSKGLAPGLEQYGAQGAQATADTRSGVRSALGIDDAGNATGQGQIGSLRGGISSRLESENARTAKELQDARAMAGGNKYQLSPEFLAAMGIDPKMTQSYGVDASAGKYLSRGQALTKDAVATAEEASRLRALEALGSQQNFLGADDSQIGTGANAKGYKFDTEKFGRDVGEQKKSYDDELAAARPQSSAANEGYRSVPLTQAMTEVGSFKSHENKPLSSYSNAQLRAFGTSDAIMLADMRDQHKVIKDKYHLK